MDGKVLVRELWVSLVPELHKGGDVRPSDAVGRLPGSTVEELERKGVVVHEALTAILSSPAAPSTNPRQQASLLTEEIKQHD